MDRTNIHAVIPPYVETELSNGEHANLNAHVVDGAVQGSSTEVFEWKPKVNVKLKSKKDVYS